LISDIYASGFAPKLVITPSYYTVGEEVFDSANFTIRPSSKASCTAPELKSSFTVYAGADCYADFVAKFTAWLDKYTTTEMLYANIVELQKVWDEAIAENEVSFVVKFTRGVGIVDVSDKYIVLGLSDDVIIHTIPDLPCFNAVLTYRYDNYKTAVADALKACAKPIDITKQKVVYFKQLGISSRKGTAKLIRKNVTRNVAYTRLGVCYAETDEYFTVIEKKLVTDAEAEAIKTEIPDAYIVENAGGSRSEKEAGKTKVYIAFKVTPFNADRETVTVDIKDIPGIVTANQPKNK
jgi:hypothetical protein